MSELADTSKSNPNSEKLTACLPAVAIDKVWVYLGIGHVAHLGDNADFRGLFMSGERGWSGRWWFLGFPVE